LAFWGWCWVQPSWTGATISSPVAWRDVAVAACGFLVGYLLTRPVTDGEVMPLQLGGLVRLGQQRFYVPLVTWLMINLPVRGLAQAARFLDGLVVHGVLLAWLRGAPRQAVVLAESVQSAGPAFVSLAFGMAGAVVAVTLMAWSLS
jgi:hypothetical protein